jgi:hypothetical protein
VLPGFCAAGALVAALVPAAWAAGGPGAVASMTLTVGSGTTVFVPAVVAFDGDGSPGGAITVTAFPERVLEAHLDVRYLTNEGPLTVFATLDRGPSTSGAGRSITQADVAPGPGDEAAASMASAVSVSPGADVTGRIGAASFDQGFVVRIRVPSAAAVTYVGTLTWSISRAGDGPAPAT